MEYTKKLKGNNCDIEISGRFSSEDSAQTQQIISYINDNKVTNLSIEMSNVDFIDSSALGQLLVIKDNIDKNHGSITIKGAKGHVKEMLDVSSFDQIFNIEE